MKQRRIIPGLLLSLVSLLASGCGDSPDSTVDDHAGHDHGIAVEADDHADHDRPAAEGADAQDDPPQHEGHDDDEGHEGHDDEGALRLTPQQMQEFDIEVRRAATGTVEATLRMPGEVAVNPDRVAHVTPRAPGVVREVLKRVGDAVEAGEVLATLESAELARAKSDYLAQLVERDLAEADLRRAEVVSTHTRRVLDRLSEGPEVASLSELDDLDIGEHRRALLGGYAAYRSAKSTAERLERLLEQEITSRAAYLEAQSELDQAAAAYASARDEIAYGNSRELQGRQRSLESATLALKAAQRSLHALGLNDAEVAAVQQQDDEALAVARLTSPMKGTVTQRHITRGEVVTTDTDAFIIADLSEVWAMLTVYPRDLAAVRAGQRVMLHAPGLEPVTASIDYVSPTLDEATRTATARVVLADESGRWRPGLFITGVIAIGGGADEAEGVVVPRSAVQEIEGRPAIFVQDADGFEPRFVELGDAGPDTVQVVSGLRAGEQYVARNGFTLKAEMGKGAFGDGHNH